MGEVDADDRRQQLGGQTDGERQREEKGLQDGPGEIEIDGEDRDDQGQGHFHMMGDLNCPRRRKKALCLCPARIRFAP